MTQDLKLEIHWLSGSCPLQSEGRVNGHPYYFRARGAAWRMEIAEHPWTYAPGDNAWTYSEPYGDGPFDAGWMSEKEAMAFITTTARKWLQERKTDD